MYVPNIRKVLEVWMLMRKGSELLLQTFLSRNDFLSILKFSLLVTAGSKTNLCIASL